jgi:predicted nucleic acid-binding protein
MIIVDTGFWLALVDQKDTYHSLAKQTLNQYNEPLITTWCVVTETCYILLKRKGVDAQIVFINSLNQGLFLGHGRIFSVDKRDFNTYRWKQNQPFKNLLKIII